MFAEMTAERHGVRAGERNDQSMKKQNLDLTLIRIPENTSGQPQSLAMS